MLSPEVKKVGVGLINDLRVLWDDLRTEMKNLADASMMARLLLVEKYPKHAYTNLALKTSAEDVLSYTMGKELGQSDWSAKNLSDEQKICKSCVQRFKSPLTCTRRRVRCNSLAETLPGSKGQAQRQEQGNRTQDT